jgi:hypothetical protein
MVPSAPGEPSAPLPAVRVTRTRFTLEDATRAAMLEPPAVVAGGDVNDTSSMVAPAPATPDTERA